METKYSLYLFSLMYAIFNVAGAAVIKNKLLTVQIVGLRDYLAFLIDPKIVIALFFIFISLFFSIKALSVSSFSAVIPLMTAINFIITVIVGMTFFKDQLAFTGYVGIVVILAGIVLLGKGYAN